MRTYGLLLSFPIIILGLLVPIPAKAEIGIDVTPLGYNWAIDPGDSLDDTLRLENTGDEVLKLNIKVYRFETDDVDNPTPKPIENEKNPYQGKVRIETNPSQLTLQPRESREIKVRLTSSAEAAAGTYQLAVVPTYDPQADKPDGDASVAVGQTVRQMILLPAIVLVKGKTNEAGKILRFITTKSTYDKGPVRFELYFRNTGAVHYQAKATIIITKQGRVVKEIAVDPKTVLPNRSRLIGYEWNDNFMDAGTYEARAVVAYGTGYTQSSVEQLTFTVSSNAMLKWALPLGGGILGGIVLLTFLGGGRRRKKKKIRRHA